MSSLFSHLGLVDMELPCTSLFCCCSCHFGFFLFCSYLGSGSSFLLLSWPMWGICILWKHQRGVLLLATVGGVKQTVDALWYRVPATLYLDGIVWWLSHCRYKSVWVVFLNTDVFRLPSSSWVTRMSRKGIDTSSLTSSQVNLILGCIELRCCRKLSLLLFLMIVNVSSTNLFHRVGGVVDVLMAWTSISSMNRFSTSGLIGEPIAAPLSAHNTSLEMKNRCFSGKILEDRWCGFTVMLVLLLRSLSSSSCFWMILMAVAITLATGNNTS